jgi:hypothetical protein
MPLANDRLGKDRTSLAYTESLWIRSAIKVPACGLDDPLIAAPDRRQAVRLAEHGYAETGARYPGGARTLLN